jgi:hypothetical protein
MINWRCWSSPFELRRWMRIKVRISLFLVGIATILYGTGFSSSLLNRISNDFQLVQLYQGDEEYSSSSELEVSTKGALELHINTPNNLSGSINLRVWDEDNCLVKFECWARANTEKKARDFVDLVDLDLDREEDLVELRLTTPCPSPWEGTNYGIKANLDIFIPEDFILRAKTFSFDLDIRGPLKKVDIENRYGKTYVNDVSENTRIDGPYNKVDIEDVQGDLNVRTTYNSIFARDVDTKGGKASFKTIYGKIDLEDIRGQIEAETIYSPIYATHVSLLGGVNKIQTVYSKIDLEFEKIEDCELYVKNTYGNINVSVPEDISARLTLTVDRGGKIHTTGILITPTVLKKTRLEGICGQGESKIEMNIDGIGKILLEGK